MTKNKSQQNAARDAGQIYPILYVRIHGAGADCEVMVETPDGDVLKRGDESDYEDFRAWAFSRAEKVECDE